MFIKVVDLKDTMYSYQKGKYLYLSSNGLRYIMIVFHTNSVYILSEPMRNRIESQMLNIYRNIIMHMKTEGLGTKEHVLYNEIPKEYKAAIEANGATHELLPPREQWRNIAKKIIQTFKNHL